MLEGINAGTAIIIVMIALPLGALMLIPHAMAWMKTDPKEIKATAGTFMTGCMILTISMILLGIGVVNDQRGQDKANVNPAPAATQSNSPQKDTDTPEIPQALIYLAFSAPILVTILAYAASRDTRKLGQQVSGAPGLAATGNMGITISFTAAIALTALITYLIIGP